MVPIHFRISASSRSLRYHSQLLLTSWHSFFASAQWVLGSRTVVKTLCKTWLSVRLWKCLSIFVASSPASGRIRTYEYESGYDGH